MLDQTIEIVAKKEIIEKMMGKTILTKISMRPGKAEVSHETSNSEDIVIDESLNSDEEAKCTQEQGQGQDGLRTDRPLVNDEVLNLKNINVNMDNKGNVMPDSLVSSLRLKKKNLEVITTKSPNAITEIIKSSLQIKKGQQPEEDFKTNVQHGHDNTQPVSKCS